MWQRFTERARRVVFFAQEEAGRLGENYVSTEHILLGMVRENDTVAALILDRLGISLHRVRTEIERQVARGDGRMGQDMQLTPRAKRVIDLAYDEARQLNNNYIGTEHLLLGLIRNDEGLAGRVLLQLGATLERAREEVTKLQDSRDRDESPKAAAATADVQPQGDWQQHTRAELIERVQSVIRSLLALDPALANLPPDALLQKLTGSESGSGITTAANTEPKRVGDLGTLKSIDEREKIEVAADAPAFLRLMAAFQAKDGFAYRALAEEQAFYFVEAGAAVKLLKPPADLIHADTAAREGGCYIRILSRTHEGRVGWIAASEFERVSADHMPFPPSLPENNGGSGSSGELE